MNVMKGYKLIKDFLDMCRCLIPS